MAKTVPVASRMPDSSESPEPELPMARSGVFDPPDRLSVLREQQPICRLAYQDGHLGWLVTSHALTRAVLADPRFSRRRELQHLPKGFPQFRNDVRPSEPGFFIGMDPPDHTRYRRLLTGRFTVRHMRELEPRIAQITAERLDAMERHGPPVDLVPEFALPIPSLVICELLGVPYEDRGMFQAHTKVMLTLGSTTEQVNAALMALQKYLHQLVVTKRAHPADDLVSHLATDTDLNDEELTNIAVLLLIAGHETTANMLGLGTFALLTHPDQLAALRADPALMEGAVEELLRYLTIVHMGPTRTALEDVELDGHLIRAGETVTLSLSEANRDPERFDHAEQLDVTRAATGQVAFGHGIHQCLGQQLARIEMRVGYTALLERFPGLRLAVPAAEVPMRTDMAIYGVHSLPVAW